MPPPGQKEVGTRESGAGGLRPAASAKSGGRSAKKAKEGDRSTTSTHQQRAVRRAKVAPAEPRSRASSANRVSRRLGNWAVVAASPSQVEYLPSRERACSHSEHLLVKLSLSCRSVGPLLRKTVSQKG